MPDKSLKQNLQSSALKEAAKDDGSARQRLIDVALKLFAEHGLDGTSTRDIAKAADLNISLISYYFGGKEGLYKTVFSEFAARIEVQTDEILKAFDVDNLTKASFQEGMKGFIEAMLLMKYESREMGAVMQREMMNGLPYAKEIYENVFFQILEKIVGLYKIGQRKGFIKKEVHPYVLFLTMIQSTECYMQMNQCQTQVRERTLKLPDQMAAYTEQIYLIFVEGILV